MLNSIWHSPLWQYVCLPYHWKFLVPLPRIITQISWCNWTSKTNYIPISSLIYIGSYEIRICDVAISHKISSNNCLIQLVWSLCGYHPPPPPHRQTPYRRHTCPSLHHPRHTSPYIILSTPPHHTSCTPHSPQHHHYNPHIPFIEAASPQANIALRMMVIVMVSPVGFFFRNQFTKSLPSEDHLDSSQYLYLSANVYDFQ